MVLHATSKKVPGVYIFVDWRKHNGKKIIDLPPKNAKSTKTNLREN